MAGKSKIYSGYNLKNKQKNNESMSFRMSCVVVVVLWEYQVPGLLSQSIWHQVKRIVSECEFTVILFVVFMCRISRHRPDFCGERELSLRVERLFTRQFMFKPSEIMDTIGQNQFLPQASGLTLRKGRRVK